MKALGEVGLFLPVLQKFRCDVNDDAFVGSLVIEKDRPVNLAGGDEDDVVCLQMVEFAFDNIIDMAAEK